MMARYIDADLLMEALQEEFEFEPTLCTVDENKWFKRGIKCAIRNVDRIPTADVVEVVRCKDCKHRNTYEEFNRNIQEMVECHCCEILKHDFGEDFFCAHGECK